MAKCKGVGDAFCGGGSVPFEAARIGCKAYGSDLNPVASLLTWAALNIVGEARRLQNKYDRLKKRFTKRSIARLLNGALDVTRKAGGLMLTCTVTRQDALNAVGCFP